MGKKLNPPRWRRVALYFYEFVYTLAPPPCSAGIIMTTKITTSMAILVTICILLINIKSECTVNVHLHFEINKELIAKILKLHLLPEVRSRMSDVRPLTSYIIVDLRNSIFPLFTLSGILSAT